jgi:CubicO group peptidase (beta-lactamase class C family)
VTGARPAGVGVLPVDTSSAWSTEAARALRARLDESTLRMAPSAIAAVAHRGRVIAIETHGEPRRDGSPTTGDTVFRIASMSKSFLAAAALSLRDEGLLDLHAPAARYVPELAAARFDGRAVEMTLDDLLSNRGGLAEDNPWGDDNLGMPRDELAAIVADGLTLSSAPGVEYQYSNLGISMLGRAIEAVTGREVDDVVRERVIDPLGLTATRSEASLYPEGHDLAAGFRTFDEGETFVPEPYVGSGALACIGSLFSTASDIAVWMHFLGSAFEQGSDDGAFGAVLSAASRRELQTARTLIPASAGRFADRRLDGAGYGYGLVVEHDRRFGRIVQHAGGLPGFSSYMRWHTATGLGVVVFGNTDEFGAGRIATGVLADLLTRVDAPSGIIRPWPATVDAARRLDELVRARQPLSAASSLLARNVLTDVPGAVRQRRLRAALDEVGEPVTDAGPLEARITGSSEPSSLRWTVPCARGALVCDVHLVGLRHPMVQTFSVQPAGPDGRKPKDEPADVSDHHAVVMP